MAAPLLTASAWLGSALALMKTLFVGGTGRALVTGAAAGELIESALIDPFTGGAVVKKRRRRKTFTASDKADIAFISGLVSKKAAGDLAVVIATRAR